MNFLEELKTLDPKDPGRWPLLFRALAILALFLVLTAVFIYFVPIQNQAPELERAQREEQDLLRTFDERQRKAANFEAYKAQLKEMERSFGAMLRQLPGRTEVPSLLVDISQTGLAAGLQEKLFQPAAEVRRDFYAELPIRIRLTGSYHQFGSFVSGIAALPRIVTLHDIQIGPEGKDASPDRLTLDVTAKTYRYLDDNELATVDKSKAKPGAKTGGGG
ncbi:MAG TPA: type 4a pilus biogenesis protein PilO [Steroidobacteraceae bacterium]|nr:type 4a pilus biogenesis protein PilO [Steroidobacteraceae bacterium]